jgi:hypothetical protein
MGVFTVIGDRMKLRDFKVGKRVISHDQVLGVYGLPAFKLKKGEPLEILEIDKYGRGLVLFRDQEFWVWAKMIDQISNPVK